MNAPNSTVDVAISARSLTRFFGHGDARIEALRGITLDVVRSQWTTIIGASGSGKTTLLHCLAGLQVPDSGTVTLRATPGENHRDIVIPRLSENSRAKLRRRRLGVVFQEFNLVPVLSARDNILLPNRLAHRSTDKNWFTEVVDSLGITAKLGSLPHELSGGQRQRVAIARALLPRPDVIFADEPTGNLDSASSDAVLGLFRRIVNDYGQTLVVVTHDPHAAACGDRTVTVRDGMIESVA